MDLVTLQAIATIVNSIGLPATIGVILVIAAWNLIPVLADYLRARSNLSHVQSKSIEQQDVAQAKRVPPFTK